jgi:serine/threonine-protein kinase
MAASKPPDAKPSRGSVASRIVLRDPPSGGEPIAVKPLPDLKQAGRYRVLGEIARGGIGVILKSRDEDLGRDVAMKIIRDEHRHSEQVLQRFIEEAQIGGQLQHPGIVPVYELGTGEDQRPFFTMKLVKGRTLSALLIDRKDAATDRRKFLSMFEAICLTIAYAHSRGVIHRDLKPANVMIGSFGEVQVVDWGLAKVLGQGGIADERRAKDAGTSVIATVRSLDEGSQSRAGSVLGTPAYMPPEQARGELDRVDERSDVFALGAILCEILTGKPPYVGGGEYVLEQSAAGDLEDAHRRLDASGADAELIQLAKECLDPVVKSRPRSAEVIAPRIGAWLSAAEEHANQARVDAADARARVRGLLLIVAILTIMVLMGGAWWWNERNARERTAGASQGVRHELEGVVAMLATARAAPTGDVAPWERALLGARSADTLARTSQADAESRARAESLLHEVERDAASAHEAAEREAKDRAMVERLQEIRGTEQDPGFTTLDDFAAAYTDYGIDVTTLPLAEAVARIRASHVRDELAMGLDYWAAIDRPRESQLTEIARAADDDPWRKKLRDAKDPAALRALAASADVATFPVEGLVELLYALITHKQLDLAVAIGEKVALVHPGDFSVRMALVDALRQQEPPRTDEALRHLTAAIALRPASWNAWRRAGQLFAEAKRLSDSLDALQHASTLRATDMLSHLSLAYAMATARRWAETAEHCKAALEVRSSQPTPLSNQAAAQMVLGLAQTNLGDHATAVETLKSAARQYSMLPMSSAAGDFVKATGLLGFALLRAGRWNEALTEAERAIALDAGVRSALAYDVRGAVLVARGDRAAGRAALEQSVKLDEYEPEAWNDLGDLELMEGRFDAAIAAYRKSFDAVALIATPSRSLDDDGAVVAAHRGLGAALRESGDPDAAIRELEAALRGSPSDAVALRELGLAQRQKGRWRDAAEAFRGAAERDSAHAAKAKERAEEVDRFAALEPKLLVVLTSRTPPASARDALDLARLCAIRRLPSAATGYFEQAFAADSSLAEDAHEGRRVEAARAAALAASGKGDDAKELDATARTAAGARALAWLRDDLVLHGEAIETGDDAEARAAALALTRWLGQPDFAAVRDDAELAKLPAAARAEWSSLWAEVRALLEKAKR